MGGEKASAVFPEERPDLVAICFWKREGGKCVWREKGKAPFAMGRGDGIEAAMDLEKEHQPVGLALGALLADQAGQVQIRRGNGETDFLRSFAAGAGIRRLALIGQQFAAAGAPKAAIGFLGALHQKDFILLIEAVKQSGDVIRFAHLMRNILAQEEVL